MTCVRAPVAKMLAKRAGATALRPLTRVRAIPFTVPRVFGDGEMSLMVSCAAAIYAITISEEARSSMADLLNAMLAPLPMTLLNTTSIQKISF